MWFKAGQSDSFRNVVAAEKKMHLSFRPIVFPGRSFTTRFGELADEQASARCEQDLVCELGYLIGFVLLEDVGSHYQLRILMLCSHFLWFVRSHVTEEAMSSWRLQCVLSCPCAYLDVAAERQALSTIINV
jgi:hypothetical protein